MTTTKTARYVVPAQHDRAETRHATLAAAQAAARRLDEEGYGPASVCRIDTGAVVWRNTEENGDK